MPVAHCPQVNQRPAKHARHTHLSCTSSTRNFQPSVSKTGSGVKSVILSEKKEKKARIQKMVNLHACWTLIRQVKRMRSGRKRREEHLKRMKYRIISQRYMRRLKEARGVMRVQGKGKVKWEKEIEVIEFDKNECPESICSKSAHKEKKSVFL